MHTLLSRVLIAAALSLLVAGCATIRHGTQQDVGFGSVPTNARITVDNQRTATTPTVMKLSRKDNHIVRIELDGYVPRHSAGKRVRRTMGRCRFTSCFGRILPGNASVNSLDSDQTI